MPRRSRHGAGRCAASWGECRLRFHGEHRTLVFYTDDLAAELRRLDGLAVRVVNRFIGSGGASFAHVLDNSGTEIVLAQLPEDEMQPSAYALIEA